ncbi:MAG: hypothetical protein HFG20_04240 [Anaerotruncus sp.]|nr:hypothetical protein [Anaerotruncus sp.]
MAPHEKLEMLLQYAIPQGDVNPLAHRLIDQFGSVAGAMDAPYEQLIQVKGMKEYSATYLKMLLSLVGLYLQESKAVPAIPSMDPTSIQEYLFPYFIDKEQEHAFLLCMDNEGKILYGDFISKGSANEVFCSPREIAKLALRFEATIVFLAHNHPKGLANPSKEDIALTEQIIRALEPLGICLQDHFIFTKRDSISMRSCTFIFSRGFV